MGANPRGQRSGWQSTQYSCANRGDWPVDFRGFESSGSGPDCPGERKEANFTQEFQRLAGEGLLHIGIPNHDRSSRAGRPRLLLLSLPGLAIALAFAPALFLAAPHSACAQSADPPAPLAAPAPSAPQAPEAQTPRNPTASLHQLATQFAEPCVVKNTGATMIATASRRAIAASGMAGVDPHAGATAVETKVCVPYLPMINWYARFLNGPEVKPLTPGEKAHLAANNLLDPFNLITIGGEAGISVAANSHSPYGPGIPGWSRYVGVSFTQDLTGEFIGTFLIPSLVHQDPHYHRMPNAGIPRRILHCVTQIAWTQGDNGRGMINYADLAGFAIDDAIGNLYVPGQQTEFSASTERYAIGLATAPIDNFVTEFLPDVARHVHIQIVIIQRVINQVARTDNTAQ
jgi:hypothetical protein